MRMFHRDFRGFIGDHSAVPVGDISEGLTKLVSIGLEDFGDGREDVWGEDVSQLLAILPFSFEKVGVHVSSSEIMRHVQTRSHRLDSQFLFELVERG